MATLQTQTQTNLTCSLTEAKNRIRARSLFSSSFTKFLFATLAFFYLCIIIQYKVEEFLLFVILWTYEFVNIINALYHYFSLKSNHIRCKKKQLFLQILTKILDCAYLLILLVMIKSDYRIFIYSNTILTLNLLMEIYTLYTEQCNLESLRKLKIFSLIQRVFVLVSALFITLKLDRQIQWEWLSVFWSIWIELIFLIGLSSGLTIVTFSKLVQYLFDKQSIAVLEIIFYLWITQLSISAATCFSLSAFGLLQYLANELASKYNFTVLQYFLITDLAVVLMYSIFFRSAICEYIYQVLQDDEPLNSQQYSMNQPYNQTLQQINQLSSRTQVPKIIQKISKTYFGIPALKVNHNPQESTGGSPVLGKYSKGHKRAFSSQGVASQMFRELECLPVEKEIPEHHNTNQTTTQIVNKYQADRKKCSSQLVTIVHDETVNKQKPDLSMSQTSNICIICYERGPNAVFMNCGHGGTCYQCAVDIWKQKEECYLCRHKIEYILQVNLEERQGDLFKVVSTTQMIEQFNK